MTTKTYITRAEYLQLIGLLVLARSTVPLAAISALLARWGREFGSSALV
jgi:hypothetical protein